MPNKLFNDYSDSIISPLIDMMMNGLAAFFIIFILSDNVLKDKMEFLDVGANSIMGGTVEYAFSYMVINIHKDAHFTLLKGEKELNELGLEFDSAKGKIHGTVSPQNKEVAIPIEVAVMAPRDTITKRDTLNIYPVCYPSPNDPLYITDLKKTLPSGRVNSFYEASIGAIGGSGRYTWIAEGLPKGMDIDPKKGVIKGIPLEEGSFPVSIRLYNSKSIHKITNDYDNSDSKTYTLTILPAKIQAKLVLPYGRVGETYHGMLQVDKLLPEEKIIWETENTHNLYQEGINLIGIPRRAGDIPVAIRIHNGQENLFKEEREIKILPKSLKPQIGDAIFQVEKNKFVNLDVPYQGLLEPIKFTILNSIPPSNLKIIDGNINGVIGERGLYTINIKGESALGVMDTNAIQIYVKEPHQIVELIVPDSFFVFVNQQFKFTSGIIGGTGNYLWEAQSLIDTSICRIRIDPSSGLISGIFKESVNKAEILITVTDGDYLYEKSSKVLTIYPIDQFSDMTQTLLPNWAWLLIVFVLSATLIVILVFIKFKE